MKKIVSVVLVVTVIVNVIGFGFLNVRSSAAVVFDDVIYVTVGGIIISLLSGALGNAIVDRAPTLEDDIQNMINSNAIQNGEVIEIYEIGSKKYFSPVYGLDSDQAELAQYLCDNLNNSDIADTLYSGFEAEYSGSDLNQGQIKAEVYKDTKNACISAFNNFINAKASAEAASGVGSSLSELGAVTYPFDFTGPIPTMTLPTKTGAVSMDIKGFSFSAPYLFSSSSSFYSKDEALSHGGEFVHDHGTWFTPYKKRSCYGYGYYVIYNGEMFYRPEASQDSIYEFELNSVPDAFRLKYYINSSGLYLKDIYNGDFNDLANHVSGGIYCFTEPKEDYDSRFPFSYEYNPSDFIVTELGEDVTFDRTPAEETIGSAIGLGLVSTNPTLTIDTTTGEITAADNIDLATLQSLVEKLSEGQLKFEDIEGYLQSIVALLQAQGADQKTINAILQGIRTNTSSIADINAAVKSIADSMSIEAEAKIELPDVDAEAFLINHTGLNEAQGIVSRIPIVNQISDLCGYVLDPDRYINRAPSFRFYWDSNNDGIQETYNAFDLSFMENTLTNSNLEDKGRFVQSMTVREFLQFLVLFICYVTFGFSLFRKLPGLFSGGESAGVASTKVDDYIPPTSRYYNMR